ncbi:MAG: hypothetical protein QM751_05900 [Paludibacteraceae bacterium]
MRNILTVFFLTLSVQLFWGQTIDNFVNNKIEVNSLNVPIDIKQPYFPREMFPEIETNIIKEKNSSYRIETKIISGSYDEFVVNWYSSHLHAMKEPLLFNRKITKEIYRFTWLRTFHKPICIRFEKDNDNYAITWKMLSGEGGYDPGKLLLNKSKKLTEKEWDLFKTYLKTSNFWQMELGRNSMGTDGAEWILEGVTPEQYRVVTVWSPEKGDFYNVCNYLISLTDLQISNREKY